MIISHKHRFIFIKTRKTGGTSVEIALSKICGAKDIITPIAKNDEIARKDFANITAQNYLLPIFKYDKIDLLKAFNELKLQKFYHHMTAAEIRRHVSKDIWGTYYKFTIDRNPFDKIVSLYYWRGGQKKFNSIYEFLTQGGLNGFSSYDTYAIDGVVAVDKVYQLENLSLLCKDLTKRLNLKHEFFMPPFKAKSGHREIKDYRELLDEKSIKLIKTIFAREMELLNYQY